MMAERLDTLIRAMSSKIPFYLITAAWARYRLLVKRGVRVTLTTSFLLLIFSAYLNRGLLKQTASNVIKLITAKRNDTPKLSNTPYSGRRKVRRGGGGMRNKTGEYVRREVLKDRWTNAHELAAELFYASNGSRADVRYVREELERRLRKEGIVDVSEIVLEDAANDPDFIAGLEDVAGNQGPFAEAARVMRANLEPIAWYPSKNTELGWEKDLMFDVHLRATLDEVMMTIQTNHRYLSLIENDRRNALAYWEQKDMSEGYYWGSWKERAMTMWFNFKEALGLSIHVPSN